MKHKKWLISVMSTATLLAACSGNQGENNATSYDENVKDYDNEEYDTSDLSEMEVELDYLKDRYPNIDLEKIEDYFEKNRIEYDEDELLAALDEYEETGSVNEQTSSYNYFPWAMFMLANRNHSSNGIVNRQTHSQKVRPKERHRVSTNQPKTTRTPNVKSNTTKSSITSGKSSTSVYKSGIGSSGSSYTGG